MKYNIQWSIIGVSKKKAAWVTAPATDPSRSYQQKAHEWHAFRTGHFERGVLAWPNHLQKIRYAVGMPLTCVRVSSLPCVWRHFWQSGAEWKSMWLVLCRANRLQNKACPHRPSNQSFKSPFFGPQKIRWSPSDEAKLKRNVLQATSKSYVWSCCSCCSCCSNLRQVPDCRSKHSKGSCSDDNMGDYGSHGKSSIESYGKRNTAKRWRSSYLACCKGWVCWQRWLARDCSSRATHGTTSGCLP